MNEIFKKFNVFDYFSHLVPGAIVVLALLHYFQCKDQASMSNLFGCLYDKLVEYNSIAFWTFFLVASHCIGLVNNVISDVVWYGFRNNTWFISASENMVGANPKPCCLKFYNVIYLLLLIFYIIHVILSSFDCPCYKTCVKYLPHTIAVVILIVDAVALIIYIFNSHDKGKLEDYYKKYEEVKVYYPSNNISNLEAQIAFLRNSIIPLFLLSLICIVKDNPSNTLLIVSPFIAFAAFFLHQQKLYFHVYELWHIIDLKNMKLKLMVLAKKKADDNKTDIVSLFSQNLKDANCAEMCYGELDGIGVGVISLEDIADASCDTIKEKIEIFKNARALVVICREGENDLYDKIKKYAKTSFFDLKEIVFEDKEANSVDRVESIIKKFFK